MSVHDNDPFSEVAVLERLVHRNIRPRYLNNALKPTIRRSFTSEFGVVRTDGAAVRILDYSPRGAPLEQNTLGKRKMKKLPIPRFGEGFTVSADQRRDVSNVALDGQIEASKNIIDAHLESVNDNMDATEENQLTHAVRGFIADKEGDVVVDLFAELGAQQQVCAIDLTDKLPWLRQLQKGMTMVDEGLTGDVTPSYLLIGGTAVGDYMETDPIVLQSQTSDTNVRLSLEDSRGAKRINSTLSFLPARKGYFQPDEAYLIPTISDFWVKMLGPSDSAEYEGNVLERYVTRETLRHGHGWEYEITEFCLQYPKKPAAVVRVDFGL